MIRSKAEMKSNMKLVFWLLGPLFMVMGVLIILLGMLELPRFVPAFFDEAVIGHARAVLYPTYVCNQIISIGGIVLLVVLLIIDVIVVKKTAPDQKQYVFAIAVVTFWLIGTIMVLFLGDQDVRGVYQEVSQDLALYKAGQVETYYGPIQKGGQDIMDGPYYSEDKEPTYFLQKWNGEDIVFNSSIGFGESFQPLEDQEYKVTYLPNTYTICEVEPYDREKEAQSPLSTIDLGAMEDIWDNQELAAWLRDQQRLEREAPVLFNALRLEPTCELECTAVELDDDEGIEYLLNMVLEEAKIKVTLVLDQREDGFEMIALPLYVQQRTMTLNILTSTSHGLRDLMVRAKKGDETLLLRYDGDGEYK